jgi:hypothetical protein
LELVEAPGDTNLCDAGLPVQAVAGAATSRDASLVVADSPAAAVVVGRALLFRRAADGGQGDRDRQHP